MFGWFKKKQPPESVADTADVSTLVPRLRHGAYLDKIRRMGVPADQLPYSEPLVGELVVVYAFDLPTHFEMATSASIQRLGLSKSEVRGVAVENLVNAMDQVGLQDLGPVKRVIVGENLAASTLLIDRFWQQVAETIPGEVVVGVPGRDYVLCCSSQSDEGLVAIRELTSGIYEREEDAAISDQLLVWRGGWQLLDG